MKSSLIFLGIIVLLYSCNNSNNGYSISGKVNGANGKVIYLSSSNKTDSAKIESDNTFKFEGIITRQPHQLTIF